jgi:hypothetical protein
MGMTDFDFAKAMQGVSNVKLPGGVVGKTCTVLLVAVVMLGGIALVVRDVYLSYFIVTAIVLFCGVILLRVISFANKNPQAALLEGAEFLVHQREENAAKGLPNLRQNVTLDSVEEVQTPIDPKEMLQIDTPDDSSETEIK